MTLPQQNIALARPANFHYLKCQLDRAQYRSLNLDTSTVLYIWCTTPLQVVNFEIRRLFIAHQLTNNKIHDNATVVNRILIGPHHFLSVAQ